MFATLAGSVVHYNQKILPKTACKAPKTVPILHISLPARHLFGRQLILFFSAPFAPLRFHG